jgi:uncharacterized protein YqgC (DUF456 family)
MVDRLKKFSIARPRFRKILGWSLVIFGFVTLVTPLTPGGSLFFVGLEVLGLRFVGIEKIKTFLATRKLARLPHMPISEPAQQL